jgi:NhaP-type Na+/H+ and K+/H+ antiporter
MVYLGALLAMKIVVVVLFAVFPWLIDVGDWLLSWTGNRGAVQVIL